MVAILLAGVLGGVEQPVLLPLPELLRLLDAKQEWLLLPVAEYDRLVAGGRDPAPRPEGSEAFIASANLRARVVDGRQIEVEADFTAVNRTPSPALADLFAALPGRLGSVSLAGVPAVLVPGTPVRLLLPKSGRFTGTAHWTVALDGGIERRQALLPLLLAGGLSMLLTGDGHGEAVTGSLVRDGVGWRLAVPPGPLLPVIWLPGGGGGDGPVFGAEHALAVTIQDGPRPLRWAVRLDARRGGPPARLDVLLPAGFTCTRPLSGVVAITPTADGVALTLTPGADSCAVEGLLAAGSPVALPRLRDAAWQSGVVRLGGSGLLACEPPAGWRALGAQGDSGERVFAVAAPDAGMQVEPLEADRGLATSGSTVVAVGPVRAILDQVLLVRAGGAPLFELLLRLPPGWKPTALSAAGSMAPPADDLEAGALVRLALPAGLKPGAELAILFSAEAPGKAVPDILPVVIADAARSTDRLLIAAAPGIELTMQGPGWRQVNDVDGLPSSARAELRADGTLHPVTLKAAPRPAAVEVDAVGWLLPLATGTWVRYDLRLAVRDGELDRLELELPLQRDADLRLTGDGLVLTGDGPFTLAGPTAWRGERLVRIEGHLRREVEGRLPVASARLPGSARPVVVRRWDVLMAPVDRDLVLAALAGARPIDADELPSWSSPIPGTTVAAAWRLGEGDPGGWTTSERSLAALPDGFVDALEIATQIGPDGWRSRATCRISAAGLGEIELGLPDGARLEQASIDGAAAAVRRDGAQLLLALPGRTLVQVTVRFAGDGMAARLPPPRLGGLPVTRTTWTVAVDASLCARPLLQAGLMPLSASAAAGQRRWMHGWDFPAGGSQDIGRRDPEQHRSVIQDPRALQSPAAPQQASNEPGIHLRGVIFQGHQTGTPEALGLKLTPIGWLLGYDIVGRVLAVLLGVTAGLAPFLTRRLLGIAACAAVPAAAALISLQQPGGPLLALLEWLPITVLAGLLIRRIWLHRRSA
jgi:hypothetical protein